MLTAVGLRTIDRSLIEAAHSMGANALQTLWYVEIPLALERVSDPTKQRRRERAVLGTPQAVQRALEESARLVEATLRLRSVRLLDENVNRRLSRHAALML